MGEFHLPPQIAKHPGETIAHDQWLTLHPIELFTHPGGMTIQSRFVFLYLQEYRLMIRNMRSEYVYQTGIESVTA